MNSDTKPEAKNVPKKSIKQAGYTENEVRDLVASEIGNFFPDLKTIATEFSRWEDSSRRVDILAIDSNGNLCVIEFKEAEPPENCLTTEADAEQLRVLLHSRIEDAAADGALLAHKDLPFLLHCWMDLTTDDGATVRAWTSAAFATDYGVRQLAKAFTSYSWTQGMGDAVAKRVTRVSRESMARLIDLDAFLPRVEAVVAAGESPEVQQFLDAWRLADRGARD